jgi:hypothetical protein
MASTWRSYQSLTAWLAPHTAGPAKTMPATTQGQRLNSGAPDDTDPHIKAHMGANQVMGFSPSSTTDSAGARERGISA